MQKEIKTSDLLFLLICNMSGIGVFSLAHHVLSHTGSCIASILLVVVSGVIATIFGLCYAELGSTYPHAGGDLNYLSKAYSKHLGTIYSLVSMAFILPSSCAIMSVKISGCFEDSVGKDCCVSVLLILCSILLTFGGRLLTLIIRILFLSKVITVIFLLVTSLVSFGVTEDVLNPAISDVRNDIFGMKPASIMHGLCFTQFSFDGWNCGNYIANRVMNPGKAFPRAIFCSIWCVVSIYTLINLSFMWIVPYDKIVGNAFFIDEYFRIIGMPITPRMLSVIVTLVPTLGSLICLFVVSCGITESFVPAKFTKRTRMVSLAVFSSVVFLFTKFSDIEKMLERITFWMSLFYSLSCFGLFLLKRRHPNIDRPFSLPIAVPLLASVLGASICGYTIKVSVAP